MTHYDDSRENLFHVIRIQQYLLFPSDSVSAKLTLKSQRFSSGRKMPLMSGLDLHFSSLNTSDSTDDTAGAKAESRWSVPDVPTSARARVSIMINW